MLIRSVWRYLRDHWQGRQGLAWSLWVNLISIRVLVFALQEWLEPGKGEDFSDRRMAVVAFAIALHGVLFVWQAVGVLRACGAHVRAGGLMTPVWGAQLVTAVAMFWVLSYALGAWQMTLPAPDPLQRQIETEAERVAKYSIEPSLDGRSLTLAGTLELGITRRLKAQLQAYPDVRRIVLSSTGGNIFEARGLSNEIRQHGLNTLVVSECSSACTTVFIAGAGRRLAIGARLGFHKYRIDADYAVLNSDPLGEQARDRAIFLRSGVAVWFLDKMYDTDASDMWYPDSSELIDARVVTSIVKPEIEY